MAALAVFAVTLGGTFVYDDLHVLYNDPRIANPRLWWQFWTRGYVPEAVDNLYRPLVSMSYAIQWQLHGDAAWPFHLVNWLLHAAVSAAVAEMARRWAGFRVGLIAGLLFAVHPIHVEPVAYVVGRAELMCALFVVAAMILFAPRPLTRTRATGVFGCVVAAMLCKEQGMFLPLLLLLWWVLRTPRRPVDATEKRAAVMLTIAVCWTLAAYIIARESMLKFWWDRTFLDWTIQPMVRSHGIDRVLMPVVLAGRYFSLLAAPAALSPDYGGTAIGWTVSFRDPYLYTGAGVIVGWTIAVIVALYRRAGVVVFCLLALAIFYGMVGNIVSLIGTIFGERLMYLPSVFFIVLAAMVIAKLPRGVGTGALVVLVTLGSVRSFTYARQWNDRLALFEGAIDRQPGAIMLYALAAQEYEHRGDIHRAAEVLARGREVLPAYDGVWVRSAQVALKLDRLDEANAFLNHAYSLRPSIYIREIQAEVDKRREELRKKSP